MSAKIDVIIPQYNRFEKTEILLKSINTHYRDRASSVDVRVILVDDGSVVEGAVDTLVRTAPPLGKDIIVCSSKNLGFVRATNMGLCASVDSPYVVLQNNDTEVYPRLYENMLEAFKENPKLGIVGPVSSETEHSWQGCRRLYERGGDNRLLPVQPEFFQMSHADRAAHLDNKGLKPLYTGLNMVAFFCTMIRREVIDKVGFLSHEFGVGLGDDDDYCARARAAGFEIGLARNAYVRHDGRTTFKDLYAPQEISEMSVKAVRKLESKYGKGGFGA